VSLVQGAHRVREVIYEQAVPPLHHVRVEADLHVRGWFPNGKGGVGGAVSSEQVLRQPEAAWGCLAAGAVLLLGCLAAALTSELLPCHPP